MTIVSLSLRFSLKSNFVKTSLVPVFLLLATFSFSQSVSEVDSFLSKLTLVNTAPENLLSTRSCVFHSADYSAKELETIQKAFQQIGVDAIFYAESELALAGTDLKNAYTNHLARRDVRYMIFIRKQNLDFQFFFVPFTKKVWVKPVKPVWYVRSPNLQEVLLTIFHAVATTQKRQSFLINDFPERDAVMRSIIDNRNETLMVNMRSAKIAIPKMEDAAANDELEQFFKENYKIKFELVDDTISEADLAQRGDFYVLRFVHTRGSLAKEILGYDMSKSESAIATVTYPNGTLQLKMIPSETLVYKFYLKNLEDKSLYFGTKWDADVTWQDALRNHLDGYRAAGKL
jgi:hypothetical protein